jgi:hypothetical protein
VTETCYQIGQMKDGQQILQSTATDKNKVIKS